MRGRYARQRPRGHLEARGISAVRWIGAGSVGSSTGGFSVGGASGARDADRVPAGLQARYREALEAAEPFLEGRFADARLRDVRGRTRRAVRGGAGRGGGRAAGGPSGG
jgi:hypothetical protein